MQMVAKTMVDSLLEKIGQSSVPKELDVEPLMKMITLDIFGHVALSTDLGLCKTLKPSPLVTAFEYLLTSTMARLRSPFRPKNFLYRLPIEQNRLHKQERRLIRSFVADLINAKRDSPVEDDKDLLSHLVRAHRDAPGGKLKPEDVSDDAMTDVLMTLLFAGYGTSSLSACIFLSCSYGHRLSPESHSFHDRHNERNSSIRVVSSSTEPRCATAVRGRSRECQDEREY